MVISNFAKKVGVLSLDPPPVPMPIYGTNSFCLCLYMYLCHLYTGPIPTVFLNNYEVVMEALVKRKADFAGRPTSVTCTLELFSISSRQLKISLKTYNIVILKKKVQQTKNEK